MDEYFVNNNMINMVNMEYICDPNYYHLLNDKFYYSRNLSMKKYESSYSNSFIDENKI